MRRIHGPGRPATVPDRSSGSGQIVPNPRAEEGRGAQQGQSTQSVNAILPTGQACQVLKVNVTEMMLIENGILREIEVPDGAFRRNGVVFLCQRPALAHGLDCAAYRAFTSVLEISGPPEPPIELVNRDYEAIFCAAPYVLERDSEGCVMMKLACVMRLCTPLRVGTGGMLVLGRG